jgi:hypothetical protein
MSLCTHCSERLCTIWYRCISSYFNLLKPDGRYVHHLFNMTKLCILPTDCVYVFYIVLTMNKVYFLTQH